MKEIKEKVLCSYPFAASLSSLLEEKLVIRVNDQEIETELHIERNGYDMVTEVKLSRDELLELQVGGEEGKLYSTYTTPDNVFQLGMVGW